MSKEKQIEEMAKVMCDRCKVVFDCTSTEMCSECTADAEALYNAGYRKQSEWISVKERLPKKDTDVLGYNGIIKIYHYEGCYKWWSDGCRATTSGFRITHWMPLPEPPQMKGGAE